MPVAWHRTDRYANKRPEYDHDRFKARLRPMRGLKQDHSARVIIARYASGPEGIASIRIARVSPLT